MKLTILSRLYKFIGSRIIFGAYFDQKWWQMAFEDSMKFFLEDNVSQSYHMLILNGGEMTQSNK